jgi:hypothetical protein
MKKKLRVKLFGESFVIHQLKIDESQPMFLNVANKIKMPLPEAILDINYFRILNNEEFQSINDLIDYTYCGLINNYKNQVEISYGRKRIAKFNINELNNLTTLFSLYNTKLNTFNINNIESGFYLEESEVGLIGTFEIVVEDFQFDLLIFQLTKVNLFNENFEMLDKVTYEKQLLPFVKSDSLLRYQRCFFKE